MHARSSLPAAAPGAAAGPPQIAHRLAWAGLIPFAFGAALIWLVDDQAHPYATLSLSAYGALVLSFLGGIHWGLAMRDDRAPDGVSIGWGVVPALVSWPAVMMPPASGLVIEGLMLVGCYAVDRHLYPRLGAAPWLVLRFRLSALAALSCFIGAAGA